MKQITFLIAFLVFVTPTLAQRSTSNIDPITVLNNVIHVSDSLRDAKNYLEAVAYLNEGLEFYDNDKNIISIEFNRAKDTLSLSITLYVADTEYTRIYERLDEETGHFYYSETIRTLDEMKELTLNEKGDTTNLDHYVNGQKHGLQVTENSDYPPENFSFHVLWKNDTVIDILNTNILYLNRKAKVISKETFLSKHTITRYGFDPIFIKSEDLIRIDEFGKTWIVIPYKVKKLSRFVKKLNQSKWKARFPN